MKNVEIKVIPAHIVYLAEYDLQNGMADLVDPYTGKNELLELQFLMEKENPGVNVPEDDYNYIEYPIAKNDDGTMHLVYSDKVDKIGKDNPDGKYRFVVVPEVRAAVYEHVGPFSTIDDGFKYVFEWIDDNGYKSTGKGRISAVHGPWDREKEEEYSNECQIILID